MKRGTMVGKYGCLSEICGYEMKVRSVIINVYFFPSSIHLHKYRPGGSEYREG